MLEKIKNNLISEIKSHFPYYLLLTVILVLAFYIRIYRVEDLMGFYYDQGRDALVIWKLWHEGKLFLIGPVTGLAGIFLGPFYYYIIAPFYLLGGGNPVYPAVILAFLQTLAILMLYVLGKSMHSRAAGIMAATIGAFSYYIMTFGRWLSNPNPILLTSLLLLYSMWMIVCRKSKKWWIATAFLAGISLHFESASAVFYLPILAIFALFMWRQLPGWKIIMISIGSFVLTLIPQLLFNFRHDNILFDNFMKLFFDEQAFRGITKFIFEERMKYFWSVFSSKIFAGPNLYLTFFLVFSMSALIALKNKLNKGIIKLFLIFLLTPLFFYTFFQGNFGNIYDYYLSGYYLPFIVIFSIGLATLAKSKLGKVVVVIFFIAFFKYNIPVTRNYLSATPATRPIALEDELGVVDWVVEDAKEHGEFNLDIYVPPVIPHSYEYLYLWRGTEACGEDLCGKVEDGRELLYIIFEEDPPHPERLVNWLGKYEDNTVIEKSAKYGGVTVERRRRL